MRRVIAMGVVVGTVLTMGAPGSAQADPWLGQWKSVDLDGSNQTLTITRRADGAYSVILFDDRAGACGGIAARGDGVGTVAGNVMTGTTTITCADSRVIGTFPFKGTYNAKAGTFTDGLGVVWSRIQTAATAKGSPLPLGRLVLTSSEVPGLRARPAKPAGAKKALAMALRPARLPRFAPTQSQMSRFGKGPTLVTSLAFVMRTPGAAKAAVTAIARAGRGTRVTLGQRGYVLRRRQSAVVWYRNRIVGAIVITLREKASTRARIAGDYAHVADARVARALSQTAYSRVLRAVGSKGQISRRTALDLFTLAFGRLPGTKPPPGPRGRIGDGTVAAAGILGRWKTLSPAQRATAASLMGINGIALPGVRWPSAGRRSSDFGDPNFTPDAAMTSASKQFAALYQQKTGIQLKLEIIAGPGSPFPAALAYALPIDDKGNVSDQPTICKITMAPAGLEQDATGRLQTLAHETFHCMQYSLMSFSVYWKKLPAWVSQGTAEWAALKATGVPWPYAHHFREYLETCDKTSLYERVDGDSLGFFGHTDDAVEDFWGRVKAVLELGAKYGSGEAYDAARGSETLFLDTWASSGLIAPKYGLPWSSSSPVKPPPGSGCSAYSIVGDSDATSAPLTVRLFIIEDDIEVDRPLLHIETRKGHTRVSDGKLVDQPVKDAWFCVDGECECPEGTEGFPPPAPTLILPAALGVTGGKGAGGAALEFVSLKEYCKEKQPLPKPPCPPHSRSAQALSACPTGGHSPPGPGEQPEDEDPPEPLQCYGHGCGRSVADPHLSPFDSPWYDFQAVGEFTLVRSTTDDLEIQVRQLPWPGSKIVSQNVAVGMRVAGDRVGVYRGDPLVVRVNGQPVLLGKKDLRLPRGGTIKPLRQGQIDVIWPDASAVRVIPTGSLSTDVIVALAAARQGKVVGLLGNNDTGANDGDDFTTRGGRRLDPKTVRETGKRAYNLLYRVFGESWRVSQKGSLFDYVRGQSTKTFTDRRFPARIASPETLKAQERRRAEAVCKRMRIQDPQVFRNCVLDVASTGFLSFAVSASTAERSVRKARKAKPPPVSKPGATVRWGDKTYTYRPGSGDGCSRTGTAIRFSAQFSTSPGKKLIYGFKLTVAKGTKDGTYTTGVGVIFEIENQTPVGIENLKVTLAGNRSRGTFSGSASTPGKEPVSGSFRC